MADGWNIAFPEKYDKHANNLWISQKLSREKHVNMEVLR